MKVINSNPYKELGHFQLSVVQPHLKCFQGMGHIQFWASQDRRGIG